MMLDRFKSNEENINLEEYVSRKEFNKLKRRIRTHQYYLDNIHTFYSLEPSALLIELGNLFYELMRFMDNVCAKYGLRYWIDRDTLSFFVRQNELMPYDDFDIAMLKSDLEKLADALESEIEDNLSEDLTCRYGKSQNCFELVFECKDFEDRLFGIRIFGYDLIEDKDSIVSDDDGSQFKADILFPLHEIQLEGFPVFLPNDSHEYLEHVCRKDMLALPAIDFNRLKAFKRKENSVDLLNGYVSMFKKINDDFK